MAAPTPISTYLHSATMVKAGVYLLLRLSPALSALYWWQPLLMVFGGFTMVYAAFHALFKTDMKAVLAYTTVAALGILVFLTGLGTQLAFQAMGGESAQRYAEEAGHGRQQQKDS